MKKVYHVTYVREFTVVVMGDTIADVARTAASTVATFPEGSLKVLAIYEDGQQPNAPTPLLLPTPTSPRAA